VAGKGKAGIKLTGKWAALSHALSKSGPAIEAEVGKATRLNAHVAAAGIRREIKAGIPPALAPLTRRIKRRTKPLVDRGDLWHAVTGTVFSWRLAYAGILRTAKGKDGKSVFNLAYLQHQGETIPVTPRMRAMFRRLAGASRAKSGAGLTGRALALWKRNPNLRWRPLKPTTTHLKIPGRPFVRYALQDPKLKAEIKKNWTEAVQRALEGGAAAPAAP
jgi:hypothetical protein